MKKIHQIIIMAVALMLSTPIQAQESGDNPEDLAIQQLRQQAESGDAISQFNLGNRYHDGSGVKQSYKEAVKWYEKAAEQGLMYAQYNLGVSYQNGQGVKQNFTKAAEYFRMAADQGYPNAMLNLGNAYFAGQGVKQDLDQATYWYTKASENGILSGTLNLANAYYRGQGVEQNFTRAFRLYQVCAAQDHPMARTDIGIQQAGTDVCGRKRCGDRLPESIGTLYHRP